MSAKSRKSRKSRKSKTVKTSVNWQTDAAKCIRKEEKQKLLKKITEIMKFHLDDELIQIINADFDLLQRQIAINIISSVDNCTKIDNYETKKTFEFYNEYEYNVKHWWSSTGARSDLFISLIVDILEYCKPKVKKSVFYTQLANLMLLKIHIPKKRETRCITNTIIKNSSYHLFHSILFL